MTVALLALDSQLLDGATWLMAVARTGIGGESNPMALALYAHGGTGLVLLVKIAAATVLALVAWRLDGRRWALVPAMFGVFGAITNILAFA
ncbi:MAG TPA: hypothetical protein VEY67_05640 [Candidatus Dormibacteraeota bacterium]|nr:hypothetical protein [Candidatus Dormibacteraeota bacterium]